MNKGSVQNSFNQNSPVIPFIAHVVGSLPVNMPDPIRNPKVQHAGRIGPGRVCLDPTSCIRPGSNLDDLVRFWPYGSGPEASRCVRIIWPGSGRTQQSQLPVSPLSHSVACFHRRSGSYSAKPARIRLGSGCLCRILAKRIRSGS